MRPWLIFRGSPFRLSDHCAKEKRYEFFFSSAPLIGKQCRLMEEATRLLKGDPQ